jgi:guanine deaminase
VIDLAYTPGIKQSTRRAESIWQSIFPTIMMGDDRAIRAVYVGGKLV